MDQEKIVSQNSGTTLVSNDLLLIKGGLVDLAQTERRSVYPQLIKFFGHKEVAAFSLQYPLDKKWKRFLKRSTDLFFSTILIVGVLSWVIPIMGLIIKIDSRGPVFFLQKRNKRNGKTFTCLKFRSMINNSEADFQPATVNDPRITRVGKFLRNHYLDELPQLFNVWWGDMSLIGPRPHMIYDNQKYSGLIEYYDYRHKVKPGLTGLAQVLGYVGETSNTQFMRDRVQLDLFYVRHWNLFLDLRIIWHTIFKFI
jgi:lipopolysaccharide/colanic/teichoic acid biosynthesis glycosyltransferase